MSFNVLDGWRTNEIGVRDDLCAAKVLEVHPDIIGFQEVDPFYREAIDPLPELLKDAYVEAPVTHTDEILDLSWNPIFYDPNKLKLLECGSEAFEAGTVYQYMRGGLSKFRTVSWGVFELAEQQKRFLFINTHFDYNKDSKITQANQEDEAKQLLRLVDMLKNKYPVDAVFVVGDYNSRIDSVACVRLKEGGFLDTHDLAIESDDSNTCARIGESVVGPYAYAIDHVFAIGDSICVEKYTTITDIRDASDHCPIVVALSF